MKSEPHTRSAIAPAKKLKTSRTENGDSYGFATATPQEVPELDDQVAEIMTRVMNEFTLLLGRFHEGIATWK
jgi:hypothetical protein